jgi:membrane-associated phospholipid phosphatase
MTIKLTQSKFWHDWRSDLATRLKIACAKASWPTDDGYRWLITLVCLAVVLTCLLLFWDHQQTAYFLALNQFGTAYPDGMIELWTLMGDERVIVAATLLWAQRYPHHFWSLLWAAVFASCYTHGLKWLLDWPRPTVILDLETIRVIGPLLRHGSFPSGHSVTAGVWTGVLMLYARGIEWRLFYLILACLAAYSRIALGVHWPVDVCAGLAGGWGAAWLGVHYAHRYQTVMSHPEWHLLWVVLFFAVAWSLIFVDSGYPQVAMVQHWFGIGLVCFTTVRYLFYPWYRIVIIGNNLYDERR